MSLSKTYLLLFVLILSLAGFSQGTWTWVHGNSTSGTQSGVLGNVDPTNTPGHHYTASPFTPSGDSLWFYSGKYGSQSLVGDQMWVYDIQQNVWNWVSGSPSGSLSSGVQGVSSPTNSPGPFNVGTPNWTDLDGNNWVMSTDNRLWKYDITTLEWTWMAGSGSGTTTLGTKGIPDVTVSPQGNIGENNINWVDNGGNLWWFNEKEGTLWEYHIDLNMWSWESGTINATTFYTNIGEEDTLNQPGDLWFNPVDHIWCSWKDTTNQLYMMYTDDASTQEVWRYNIGNGMWACLQNEALPTTGIYDTVRCEYSSGSLPSLGKECRIKWTDDCGILWFLTHDYPGGIATNRVDFWKYNGYSDQYALIDSFNYRAFGTQHIPSANNRPYPKIGAVSWTSTKGFWMMEGKNCNNSVLWKYQPDTVITDFNYSDSCGIVSFENLSQTGCNTIKECIWDFGDGTISREFNPTHEYLVSGQYDVKLKVYNCTWDVDSIIIPIQIAKPSAGFSFEVNLEGDSVSLVNTSQGQTESYWIIDGDTLVGNDTIISFEHGEHSVSLVTNNKPCSDIDITSQVIIIEGVSMLVIPNVFTPNADNVNDYFSIRHKNLVFYDLAIYNRWGNPVFKSNDPDNSWNGLIGNKEASEGTYYFVIKARGVDNHNYEHKGYVNLFR